MTDRPVEAAAVAVDVLLASTGSVMRVVTAEIHEDRGVVIFRIAPVIEGRCTEGNTIDLQDLISQYVHNQ